MSLIIHPRHRLYRLIAGWIFVVIVLVVWHVLGWWR
jgi:hypothetical protein